MEDDPVATAPGSVFVLRRKLVGWFIDHPVAMAPGSVTSSCVMSGEV